MNNFGEYIKPEEALKRHNELNPARPKTLKYFQRLARSKAVCCICGQPAWKLADCDMCFSCATGETDASDDCELIE